MPFTNITRRIDAIQWDGMNARHIQALVGPENCISGNGRLQVRANGGEPEVWRDVFPGCWVSKDLDDGFTTVHSAESFAHQWQPE